MLTKQIIGYSFWEFLNQVQEAVNDGYRLDDHINNFPQHSIGFYECGLVKEEQVAVSPSEALGATFDTTEPSGTREAVKKPLGRPKAAKEAGESV